MQIKEGGYGDKKKTCDCGCMILGPYSSKFVLSVLNPREVQNGTFNFKN